MVLFRAMHVNVLRATLAAALFLGACSGAAEDASSPLVIVDDGQVVVLDADGSNRIPITDESGSFFFQPVWSDDGTRVAFSRVGSNPAIYMAAVDGTAAFFASTETVPFYFAWSSLDQLALLRNGETGIALEVTSVADDQLSTPFRIESGAPLYFSWDPGGGSLVTHVGSDRLDVNDLDTSRPLGPSPGAFQSAPWTSNGILAAEQGTRDQRLISVEPDGTSTPLASLLGPTTIVANHDGSQVAVQSILDGRNGVNASYQVVPTVPTNRVVVVDIASGTQTAATDSPALAYFWSPIGDQLLILDVVQGPAARWSIWADDRLAEIVRFEPDPSFLRELVPFFDQYAQSVSLWAPDGSAFAFPGTIDGEAGIWVQQIDGDRALVSSGNWVSWSP